MPTFAFDRDPTTGFRLVRTFDGEEALATLRRPVSGTTSRDYRSEEPVSDAEYRVFHRLSDYDPVPLNAVFERTDMAEHWVRPGLERLHAMARAVASGATPWRTAAAGARSTAAT